MTGETADAVRRTYQAFTAGDFDAMFELLDPDVEWHQPEHVPGAKVFHGHEGVRTWLRDTHEAVEDIQIEPVEVIDAGAEVIAVVAVKVTGRGSRVQVEQQEAHVFDFEGNRAIRVRGFNDRAEALEAAGIEA
jgi:uncharacterized protein